MLHGWSYDETHPHRLITPLCAWFPCAGNPIGDAGPQMANAAAPDVLSWLETIEAPSIGLLGFSQGGAMAHQLMRCAPHRFAYCVSLAGFVVRNAQPGDAALSDVRPPG